MKDIDEDNAKQCLAEGLKHKDTLEFFIENNPKTLANLKGVIEET